MVEALFVDVCVPCIPFAENGKYANLITSAHRDL